MSAEYNSFVEINGNIDDVLKIVGIIHEFQNSDEIYFDSVRINKKNKFYESKSGDVDLDSFKNESDLYEYIKKAKGKVYLNMGGPYGGFAELEEVKLFERMSEVAPKAFFKGYMSGSAYGVSQCVEGEFTNGMLTLKIDYPKEIEYDEDGEEVEKDGWDAINTYDPIQKKYIDDKASSDGETLGEVLKNIQNENMSHNKKLDKMIAAFKKVVPYDRFLELSGLDEEKCDEDSYEELLLNYELFGADYDAFCEFCGDYLSEEQFNEFKEKVLLTKMYNG